MYEKVEEGNVLVKVGKGKVISKQLEVFYNPMMKLNRDISVCLLDCVENKDIKIGLPLAGSGVRGIRFIKELDKSKVKRVYFNDYSKDAVKTIKENLKLNKIKGKFSVSCKDANKFLLEEEGFNYLDIDPFGSPNMFLDSAVKRLSRGGIFAVTATDTAALCGTFPKTCLRKYWAKPMHGAEMYEIGLRILIRKVQLIGGQYDKALIPIFSYTKDHYMRVFFRAEKGKKKVDEVMKKFGMYKESGPLWLGGLFDRKLVRKMAKICDIKFLNILKDELDIIGYYDIHKFCKKNKLKIPRSDDLIKVLKEKGFKVSKTHFIDTAIKSNIEEKELIKIISKI